MLMLPGICAIAYSSAKRTSRTGSLRSARIFSSCSVLISGVIVFVSPSVVLWTVFSADTRGEVTNAQIPTKPTKFNNAYVQVKIRLVFISFPQSPASDTPAFPATAPIVFACSHRSLSKSSCSLWQTARPCLDNLHGIARRGFLSARAPSGLLLPRRQADFLDRAQYASRD